MDDFTLFMYSVQTVAFAAQRLKWLIACLICCRVVLQQRELSCLFHSMMIVTFSRCHSDRVGDFSVRLAAGNVCSPLMNQEYIAPCQFAIGYATREIGATDEEAGLLFIDWRQN